MDQSKYWMVVWNKITGDFKNAMMNTENNDSTENVCVQFESAYPEYRVIHIGEGELPPKTYRSLQYVN